MAKHISQTVNYPCSKCKTSLFVFSNAHLQTTLLLLTFHKQQSITSALPAATLHSREESDRRSSAVLTLSAPPHSPATRDSLTQTLRPPPGAPTATERDSPATPSWRRRLEAAGPEGRACCDPPPPHHHQRGRGWARRGPHPCSSSSRAGLARRAPRAAPPADSLPPPFFRMPLMGPRPAAPDAEAAGTDGASMATSRPLPAAAASAGPAPPRPRTGDCAPWRPAERNVPGCRAPARSAPPWRAGGGSVAAAVTGRSGPPGDPLLLPSRICRFRLPAGSRTRGRRFPPRGLSVRTAARGCGVRHHRPYEGESRNLMKQR